MLQQYGVSAMADKAYVAMPEGEPVDPRVIAEALPDGASVASTLTEMRDAGLVHETPDGRWQATSLPVALAILADRRITDLQEAALQVRTLTALVNGEEADPPSRDLGTVRILESREAIGSCLWETLATVHKMRGFDRPPYANPRGGPMSPEWLSENAPEWQVLERGGSIRTVYHPGFAHDPDRMNELTFFIRAGEQARYANTPMKLMIFDDNIAMISSMKRLQEIEEARRDGLPEPPPRMVVIYGGEILTEIFLSIFEMVWEEATDFAIADGSGLGLDRRMRNVAQMLVAGADVPVIGRRFGKSESTVRRWIREMMDATGADTTFRLGAVLRDMEQDGLLGQLPEIRPEDRPPLTAPE